MNILAIDTSSSALVLGLQIADNRDTDVAVSDRSHSRDILPSITRMLDKQATSLSELDYIVYGQGPGSFTGLRIAVGVVQGLAYGLNIPVVPVSTLACLAQAEFASSGSNRVVVAKHARKEEVYLGIYEIKEGIATVVGSETVLDVKDINQTLTGDWTGVGDGWVLRDQLEAAFNLRMKRVINAVHPDPDALLDLGIEGFGSGRTVDALNARPEYLREEVATPSKPA